MRIALRIAAACAGLAGCALADSGVDQSTAPLVLLDSYLIAHGMAATYANNPDANIAVVQELARLDGRAADAVRALAQRHGGNLAETSQAIAALTDYAARQSAFAEP